MTSYEGCVILYGSYCERSERYNLRMFLSLALNYDQVIKGVFTLIIQMAYKEDQNP